MLYFPWYCFLTKHNYSFWDYDFWFLSQLFLAKFFWNPNMYILVQYTYLMLLHLSFINIFHCNCLYLINRLIRGIIHVIFEVSQGTAKPTNWPAKTQIILRFSIIWSESKQTTWKSLGPWPHVTKRKLIRLLRCICRLNWVLAIAICTFVGFIVPRLKYVAFISGMSVDCLVYIFLIPAGYW